MTIGEQLRHYRETDPNAPESPVFIYNGKNQHGPIRVAFWIGGQYASLMCAPLDANDYPLWARATEVDKQFLTPPQIEIAKRAEFTIRTAELCSECGTPAGRRCDDDGCQGNWW